MNENQIIKIFFIYQTQKNHLRNKHMQEDPTHNQHQMTVKDSGFTFCHCPTTLKGIVMLADHQTIIDNLLKDAIQPNYFWVYENTDKIKSILQELPEQIKQSSFGFSKISLMKQFLSKKSKNSFRKIVIVCSTSIKEEAKKQLRGSAFIGLVLYSLTEDKTNQGKTEDESEEQEQNKYDKKKVMHCSCIKQLKNLLKLSKWSFAEEKQFPTFVLLRQQVEKSTMLSRVLRAMIQQQLSLEVRKQILVELSQLFSSLCQFHKKLSIGEIQLQNAFKNLQKGFVSYKYIIRLYSSEKHQLYVLLNSFLRGLKCPTELYYIQPIVKDLYEAIKNVESKQRKKNFICYRGGFISLEEFIQIHSAVGEVIQNLGFLSASKNQDVADTFSSNVIFEIDVKDNPGELRTGFAYISLLSQFVFEEEVLFNPLNNFNVAEVTEINKRDQENNPSFFIGLQSCTPVKREEDENQHVQVIKTLLQLHAEINQNNYKQIHVIFDNLGKQVFLKAQIFFNFINRKIYEEFETIPLILNLISGTIMDQFNVKLNQRDDEEIFEYLFIVYKMGVLLTQNSKPKEGMQLLNKCKILTQFINEEKKSIAFSIQFYIGRTLLMHQRFKQALRIFLKIQQMGKQVFKDQNIYYESLIGLASTLNGLNRYEEAMEIFNEILKLRKQIYGEMHPKIQSITCQIGLIYQTKGEYHKSIDCFSKCLEIQKSILGEKHPFYYTTSFNLAYSLMMIGRDTDGLEVLKRSLSVQKIELGESHSRYLVGLSLMIDILQKIRKLKYALYLCRILIRNVKTYYDEDFPLYFSALASLVNLLITTGQLNDATFLNQKINKKLVKSEIQTINIFHFAELLFQNGRCYYRLLNHKKALEIFRKCYSIFKKMIPETHLKIVYIFEVIGRSYLCLDQHEKALEYLSKCQGPLKNIFGQKNDSYLKVIESIGYVLWKMKKFNKSLEMALKCYNLWIQINGEDNPTAQNLIFFVAKIFKDLGQTQKGVSMLKNFIEKNKLGYSTRSLFFQELITYALQISDFEQTQNILEKIPMPLVFRQYSFSLQILVRIPKFTLYLHQFQKYILHCKEETRKLYGEGKKKELQFLSLKERQQTRLSKKRKVERNREKGSRSWMLFLG